MEITTDQEELYCKGIAFKEMPYSVLKIAQIARDFGVKILEGAYQFRTGRLKRPDGLSHTIFREDFRFNVLDRPTRIHIHRNRVHCPFMEIDANHKLRCKTGVHYKGEGPPCIVGINFERNSIDPMLWRKRTDNWFETLPSSILS